MPNDARQGGVTTRLIALFALALAVSGCAAKIVNEASQQTVVVTAADNGATILLRVGQTLQVRLKGNPTTGYRWLMVETPGQTFLKAEGGDARYEPEVPPSNSPMVGAGGHEVWTLHPVRTGEGVIRFEYRRPWENGIEPVESVMYTYRVK